jgi:serine/threonine-protein kinase
MSPESALGETLDARADTWSLAVVAYEALTGVLPFEAPTTESMLRRIADVEPTPLGEVFARTTPSLEAFFARAFAPRIEDRFQTASELASAFASAVATRSVPAPRAPRFSLGAVIRRDRARFVAIAAVCAAAIGAGAMLALHSSSSSVTPVAQTHAPAPPVSYVASVRAPPVATQIETPAPPPLMQPKAKPIVAKPKPNVDPSSIF